MPPRCAMCGASPAADITLVRRVGRLTRSEVDRLDSTFCRVCGVAAFRRVMDRTLRDGWWSLLGLVNLVAVARNLRAHRRLMALSRPNEAATPPLDVGPPLRARAGAWTAAGLFGVLTAGAALAAIV